MKSRNIVALTVAAITVLELLTSSVATAKELNDSQRKVLREFARAKEVSVRCPIYKVNDREFGLWGIEAGLSVADVESGYSAAYMLGVTNALSKELDAMDRVSVCEIGWEKYGLDGDVRANLLLKR